MTRPQLQKALLKIGWRIENSHNGLNDFIIDHNGKRTKFVLEEGKLKIRSDIFGNPFQGHVYLEIKYMKITTGSSSYLKTKRIPLDKIDRVTLEISKGAHISFYNLDK